MFISSTVVGFATVGVAGLLGIWAYLGLRHRTRLGSSGSRLVTTVEGDSSQTTQLLDSGSSEPITKESVRRYAHPKIGLIDLHPEVTKALAEAGYAVDEGSFGRPYKVISQGTGLFQVVQNGKLPGLPEKEVLDRKSVV